MIRYTFKDGPLTFKAATKADPQKIGEELAVLQEGNEGRLNPANVVDAARVETSALHPHFEWDDAVAAERYRLEQARTIIRSIVAVDEDKGEKSAAPAFISINDGGTSYRAIDEVRNSVDLQTKLLAAADRDLESFQTRYRTLKEVCAVVQKARDVVRRKREAQESRVAA